MTSGTMMALVMNLLLILFSATIVRSDQSELPLKSFKISENVTYDCINIYKQPGLDHPLLKNHKIQMEPSLLRNEIKNQTSKGRIECPNGSVPVLRSREEFIANAKLFAEKHFHPLSIESPGTHIAGVRAQSGPYHGVAAWFDGFLLDIGNDQESYNQIFLGSKLNNDVNYISAGWMMNPSLVGGDKHVWSYGFWKGKDGNGCYNVACPGFVQVAPTVPIAEPIYNLKPGEPAWSRLFIHQDKQTGNWWLTQLRIKETVDVGYWPKELFNLLINGANIAGAGGLVKPSPSGSSPPMGNGKFPNGRYADSAMFTNVDVLDSDFEKKRISSSPVEILDYSPNCYGIRIGKVKRFHRSHLGYFFNYGGPGGNSCKV